MRLLSQPQIASNGGENAVSSNNCCCSHLNLTSPNPVGADSKKMSFDYDHYLIASSPPGYEFLKSNFAVNCLGESLNIVSNSCTSESYAATGDDSCDQHDERLVDTYNCEDRVYTAADDERLAVFADRSGDLDRISKWEECYFCDMEWCDCPSQNNSALRQNGTERKKVKFADDAGQNLTAVRVISEPSDCPPDILPEIVAKFSRDLTISEVSDVPSFMVNFAQPAANFSTFRQKIAVNYVSLENVFVRGYSLIGSIKVRNVAFEKRVTVRCTFDNWKTFGDYPTAYVDVGPTFLGNTDTFSFEIQVPSWAKKVQFAVRYSTPEQEFWDNNAGGNYEVVSTSKQVEQHHQNTAAHEAFSQSMDQTDNRSNFFDRDNTDVDLPYW